MARPKTLITDFRDLPELSDDEIERGRSLPAFLAYVVTVASAEEAEAHVRSPIPCRCRPSRRACPGVILIDRHAGRSEIEWHCSECEFNGVITHWEGSSWDCGAILAPQRERSRGPEKLEGRWRIVEMEVWDAEAIDLLGPGFIEFDERHGSVRFIAVEGGLDCRYGEVDGRPSVEFSWRGVDDRDEACGRGWAHLQPDGTLVGRIFFHEGDDSSFAATRFEDPRPRKPRRRGMH